MYLVALSCREKLAAIMGDDWGLWLPRLILKTDSKSSPSSFEGEGSSMPNGMTMARKPEYEAKHTSTNQGQHHSTCKLVPSFRTFANILVKAIFATTYTLQCQKQLLKHLRSTILLFCYPQSGVTACSFLYRNPRKRTPPSAPPKFEKWTAASL